MTLLVVRQQYVSVENPFEQIFAKKKQNYAKLPLNRSASLIFFPVARKAKYSVAANWAAEQPKSAFQLYFNLSFSVDSRDVNGCRADRFTIVNAIHNFVNFPSAMLRSAPPVFFHRHGGFPPQRFFPLQGFFRHSDFSAIADFRQSGLFPAAATFPPRRFSATAVFSLPERFSSAIVDFCRVIFFTE